MRAAAFFAASLVLIGTWIVLAAALTMSAAWIGFGILAIAVATAIGHLATAPTAPGTSRAATRASALSTAD